MDNYNHRRHQYYTYYFSWSWIYDHHYLYYRYCNDQHYNPFSLSSNKLLLLSFFFTACLFLLQYWIISSQTWCLCSGHVAITFRGVSSSLFSNTITVLTNVKFLNGYYQHYNSIITTTSISSSTTIVTITIWYYFPLSRQHNDFNFRGTASSWVGLYTFVVNLWRSVSGKLRDIIFYCSIFFIMTILTTCKIVIPNRVSKAFHLTCKLRDGSNYSHIAL